MLAFPPPRPPPIAVMSPKREFWPLVANLLLPAEPPPPKLPPAPTATSMTSPEVTANAVAPKLVSTPPPPPPPDDPPPPPATTRYSISLTPDGTVIVLFPTLVNCTTQSPSFVSSAVTPVTSETSGTTQPVSAAFFDNTSGKSESDDVSPDEPEHAANRSTEAAAVKKYVFL